MWGTDKDNSGYLLKMIQEARLEHQWIEVKGKLYAYQEVEETELFNKLRYSEPEEIKLKDPIAELNKADARIANKICEWNKRREAFLERIKKYHGL
ncbi:MAG: hypothetical protein EPN37_15580 [Chitinophagaceae bacterium]|nr:MAG: hypothetical protein EPN37_15580 [Chitinophagaceae bacterium]